MFNKFRGTNRHNRNYKYVCARYHVQLLLPGNNESNVQKRMVEKVLDATAIGNYKLQISNQILTIYFNNVLGPR